MGKRLRYEAGLHEDDYVKKCMSCKHSYTRINESDTLFCSCKNGCSYERRLNERNTIQSKAN